MNPEALNALCKLRGLRPSDLARMAGVSRQAVSRWMRAGADMRSSHLLKLSQALQLRSEQLLSPLPILEDTEAKKKYEAMLLWDRLYPSLLDFSVALVRGEAPALARLVQVFGIHAAAKIAGRKIWERFPEYKRFIRPVRKEQIEKIWQTRQNLKAS